MTDRTGDDDTNHQDTTAAINRSVQVPEEAKWELEIQVPFDAGEQHDLTSAIIVGVARTEDVSPTDIKQPPLYQILDVAALEEAFFGSDNIGQRSDNFRSVEFMYRGHRIVVRSDAWVQVYRSAEK